MSIKAILFDFGGTLDSDGVDWFSRIFGQLSRFTNGRVKREEFQVYADEAAAKICHMEDTSGLLMDKTVLRLCEQTRGVMAEKECGCAWEAEIVARGFMEESESYLRRNLDILKSLGERFRLGCISNNWGNTAGWCGQFGFDAYFETMIDSTLVGSVKPDGRIFEAALDELDLAAQECVYVGDRYDCDVLGAHGCGMKPVWITSDGERGDVESVGPLRIARLPDLLDIKVQEQL